MPGLYIFNGKFLEGGQPSLHPDDRGYRYGDGLFETIRVSNGTMPLWDLHMSRLLSGLDILKITLPKLSSSETLKKQVTELCSRNRLVNARIRISVSRGEGGILEHAISPNICIQSWPLDEAVPRFNQNGLQLGIYRDAAKSADLLANLKSSNYLIYVMAALHARDHKWNDALVLNTHGRIADTSIANICWVREGRVFTLPQTEGPVNGVMLQWLKSKLEIHEEALHPEQLPSADEVFITNAVRGIQWVGRIENMEFNSFSTAFNIYTSQITPLFS